MAICYDTVVIGGGVIGLSVAYEAACRGLDALVIERDRPGGGATPVAAGMLAPVSEAEPTEPALLELGLASARLYPEFVERLEEDSGQPTHYERCGTLAVGLDRDDLEELDHLAASQRQMGLEVRRLGAREVRELEPRLSPKVVGGYLVEEDGQVDPRALSAALVEAIARRGGEIWAPAEVTELIREDEESDGGDERNSGEVEGSDGEDEGSNGVGAGAVLGVRVERSATDAGTGASAGAAPRAETVTVEAGAVVVAAGAWSARALDALGDLPMRPVKGQVLRLRGEAGLLHHVVRTPEVYVVPRPTGEIVVGASVEEQGFDESVTAGVIMDLLEDAWEVFPGLYDLELTELSAGLRPALRDNLPAIGPTVIDGLFLATGHYRNGILLAPVTARLLVDSIATGAVPDELRPFLPDRFES